MSVDVVYAFYFIFFTFLRASGASDFIICLRASAAVAEPAGRGLHVHLGGASETFQEGVRPLRLLSHTLLCPFSQSHHYTNYPEDRYTDYRIKFVIQHTNDELFLITNIVTHWE